MSSRLGQNFLKDKNILKKEVEIARVKGKTVLEIGAGDGRLTEQILRGNPSKVIAVEKDREFADILKEKFGKRVQVVNADFLAYEISEVNVIIGNIPYYITSQIIFKIKDTKFKSAVLIVQREFAEKMIAEPNDHNYGRLSVTSQLFFDVKIIQKVSRHLFSPPPRVNSSMILLKRRENTVTKHDEEIIRILFQHKNKTVKNALLDSKKFKMGEIEKLGDFLKKRARTLSKEKCLKISRKLL